MNKVLLASVMGMFILQGIAQQVPFYNHNIINPYIFNPAMAGASGDVNAFLVRNQRFNSFVGPSINNYLTIDGSFKSEGNSGFGLQVSHQSHGIQQQFASAITYSYKAQFNKASDLRFGLNAGLLDNRIDLNAINVQQTDDPYLLSMRPNVTSFDMSAGLSFRWKAMRIGFAVPQLIGNKVTYDKKESARGYYRLARHLMLTAEYDIPLGGELILKPYGLVRYVPGAPLQYDVTAHLDHGKIGWISVGYKSDYSIQGNIGFRIMEQFKIGYSYEYLIGSMKNYSTGAHNELMIGFVFRPKRKDIVKTVEKEVEKIVEVEKVVEVEKIVEVEKVVEVEKLIEDEETKKQNEELKKRIEELEKLLAEKQVIPPPADTLPKKADPEPDPERQEIPVASGYHFVELDFSDAPDGLYVISGVFASKKNALNVLAKTKQNFDDCHLVINKNNGYYYVVVLYTLDQDAAEKAVKKHKRTIDTEAWILNYKLER